MAGRKKVASDEDILAVLAGTEDPVLSTKEVAENLPIKRAGTYSRLKELEDAELVASKKIANGTAWWITDQGRERLASDHDGSEPDPDEA